MDRGVGYFQHGPPFVPVTLLVANDAPLGLGWLDHRLKWEWADHRECHIGGDFLLIYQLDANWINFVRSGTHSEHFEHQQGRHD